MQWRIQGGGGGTGGAFKLHFERTTTKSAREGHIPSPAPTHFRWTTPISHLIITFRYWCSPPFSKFSDPPLLSYLEDVDVESIKKLRASVPTVPLQLPETSSSLGAGLDESSEGHEHAQVEWIRTVYQKKRLLSIKRARTSCGVGGTSHEIPHHSPEPAHPGSSDVD